MQTESFKRNSAVAFNPLNLPKKVQSIVIESCVQNKQIIPISSRFMASGLRRSIEKAAASPSCNSYALIF
jgi:hypothetical protein